MLVTSAIIATAIGAAIALAFVAVFLALGVPDPLGGLLSDEARLARRAWCSARSDSRVGVGLLARLRRGALAAVAAASGAVILLASVVVPGDAGELVDRQSFAKVLSVKMWPAGRTPSTLSWR